MSNQHLEAHSTTDGRRRVYRDAAGWVKGVRWALGKGGAHCRTESHSPTDYADAKGVRRCGACKPK